MTKALLLAGLIAVTLPAVALAQEATAEAPDLDTTASTDGEAEQLPVVDPSQSRYSLDEGKLLPEIVAAIASEREALHERAAALDQREAELAFAASALREQSTQLTALKVEIETLLKQAEVNHHEDVGRLVKIYRAMKPIEAAAILSSADLEVSVLVLAAMVERDSGPIIAKMNPERARAVSKIILQRSRLPGDQRLVNLKID